MSLVSRIKKLEGKFLRKEKKVYFIGWANCTWTHSEGLIRFKNESKEEFCKRVHLITNKQHLWFT